ncbi:endo-1,4-beta-xylanase [Mobilitalea sibirica]|uniref:Beta-xylanase n=1 Tax=Mobilitalea sibirica TaxID=1462919 RepID=A0A8J7KVW2_9FIRM|nr:endo-1,4-beta-xylanase [Mobilitalea sibirica]MBH1939627.1 endo-1,4-beta-xylanase [Mobilitalea sibirica]
MKRTGLKVIFVMLFALLFLFSCSKKENEGKDQNDDIKQAPSQETVSENESKAEENASEEDANSEDNSSEQAADNLEEAVEEIAEPIEPVIVDGYDITAAVSGTPLKDAYKDYFMIGVGLNGSAPDTDTVRSAAMTEIIKYHFNSTTYSNLMKPSYLLNQQGSIQNFEVGNIEPAVNFDTVKAGLDFCKENKIKMRGHVLVWHNQVPDWFFREGYQSDGAYVEKDVMLGRLESYIKQVLEYVQTKYPGVIYSWDVVNEAVENSPGSYEKESGFNIRTHYDGTKDNLWYKVIGIDYVEKSFEYARKYADPEVKLFYNDYNTFQPTKTSKIHKLVSHLKEKGLVDGIGMQGYMDLSYPGIAGGNDNLMSAITKFAELDLEIQITELTIRSKDNTEASMEKQAERYKSVFELLKGLDTASGRTANITSVTVFGLMDQYLFYTNDTTNARLFDGQLQPKPAFYSIMSVVE